MDSVEMTIQSSMFTATLRHNKHKSTFVKEILCSCIEILCKTTVVRRYSRIFFILKLKVGRAIVVHNDHCFISFNCHYIGSKKFRNQFLQVKVSDNL